MSRKILVILKHGFSWVSLAIIAVQFAKVSWAYLFSSQAIEIASREKGGVTNGPMHIKVCSAFYKANYEQSITMFYIHTTDVFDEPKSAAPLGLERLRTRHMLVDIAERLVLGVFFHAQLDVIGGAGDGHGD